MRHRQEARTTARDLSGEVGATLNGVADDVGDGHWADTFKHEANGFQFVDVVVAGTGPDGVDGGGGHGLGAGA
jgi:hypothetical protein